VFYDQELTRKRQSAVVMVFAAFLITACETTIVNADSSGSGGASGGEEANQWQPGSYFDNEVTGGGLSRTRLKLKVLDSGRVLGSLQGTRNEDGFSVSVKGSMANDGELQASGSRSGDNVRLVGRFANPQGAKQKLVGKIGGTVNGKNLKVAFDAIKR